MDAEVQVCIESECNDVSVLQTQAVVDNFIDNSQLLDNAYAKLQFTALTLQQSGPAI